METPRRSKGRSARPGPRQQADNPSNVTVWHFNDLATAQKVAGSERLKQAMANAGVAPKPEIWFTRPA